MFTENRMWQGICVEACRFHRMEQSILPRKNGRHPPPRGCILYSEHQLDRLRAVESRTSIPTDRCGQTVVRRHPNANIRCSRAVQIVAWACAPDTASYGRWMPASTGDLNTISGANGLV